MRKPLVVIDTNVYISATTVYQSSPTKQILDALQANQIEAAISEPLLSELAQTLKKPQVRDFTGYSDKQERVYIEGIRELTNVVSGDVKVTISSDPKDDMLFACAMEARADYIISGDRKHVLSIPKYRGVKTISPRDFVETVLEKIA